MQQVSYISSRAKTEATKKISLFAAILSCIVLAVQL